jgi:hypothetical protein
MGKGDGTMDQFNRRSALALGAAAVAGLVAYPLTSKTASADEEHHRWPKLHAAVVALKEAREELEHSGHDWGGDKKEAIEAIDRALVHLEKLRDWHE